MEVRGHWQLVDMQWIYAAYTETHADTGSYIHGGYGSGFSLLLIFECLQLQIPEPKLFSALLPELS